KRSTTWPSSRESGKPTLNFDGGSESTLGKRKRRVPRVRTPNDATIAAQPAANQLVKMAVMKPRRPGLAGAFAAGFGAAAAGAGAGVGAGPGAGAGAGAGVVDSDIGTRSLQEGTVWYD